MKLARVAGFTMVELMVVLAIAAIVLLVALPDLRPQVAAADAKSVASGMADALQYARQYALNTSNLVTFTPSGCGYTVATASGTQLLSSASTGGNGVSCQPLAQSVSFLGDGSVSLCTQGVNGLSCSPAAAASSPLAPAVVSGGGSSWTISLSAGGLISTNPS